MKETDYGTETEQTSALPEEGEQKKPKSRKKRKMVLRWIFPVVIVLLLAVIGYSGFQIFSRLNEYREAEDLYEQLIRDMLSDPSFITPETVPSGESLLETEGYPTAPAVPTVPVPSTQAPQPSTQAPQPSTEVPEPSTQAPEPSTQAPQPTTEVPEPTTEVPQPTVQDPTQPPATDPVQGPTEPSQAPTQAPTQPPTAPPTQPPTEPPTQPPTVPPETAQDATGISADRLKAMITTDSLRLRMSPDSSRENTYAIVYPGTTLYVYEFMGDWCSVVYQGKLLYCATAYLRDPSVPTQPPATQAPTQPLPTAPPATAAPTRPSQAETAVGGLPISTIADKLSWLTVNFKALQNLNSEVVAWLQGQGDGISYPVVQGTDNDYYLTHLFNGVENGCGSLFVDYRNRFLRDDLTLIYGHHMRNGTMFGQLENYRSQSYYRSNPVLHLYTPAADYVLEVFAAFYTDTNEVFYLNFGTEQAFNDQVSAYLRRSSINTGIRPVFGERMVALYTCSFNQNEGRFIVFCRLAAKG
ncbi:MAG: class B sortase [Lachnospiraceae bacterium]|nr:class B sortase [Lachnospiraceae bacterium]